VSLHAALLAPPDTMNVIQAGTNKAPLFEYVDFSKNTLVLDDGSLIDGLKLPLRRKVTRFDYREHTFNPLQGMDYKRARDFIAVIDALFPEGQNTLTRKNANFILLNALLGKVSTLDRLLKPSKDPAAQDAYQKIATLMLSPVLKRVLCAPKNFSLKGVVLARLDRAELGDFDCFVLGNFLISQFDGTVVVPDGGFYLRDHHTSLIRQGRLVAGVNTLSEVPVVLRHALLTIPKKIASGAIYPDAVELAYHAGLRPDPTRVDNPFNQFIDEAMKS